MAEFKICILRLMEIKVGFRRIKNVDPIKVEDYKKQLEQYHAIRKIKGDVENIHLLHHGYKCLFD